MKRFNLLVIIIALLATASIVFAQRQSSAAASGPPQTTAPYSTHWGWCPMAGGGWTNHMNGYGMPGWMRGDTNMPGPGRYGAMGPGMMYGYGPATNSTTGNNPTTQEKPQSNNQQQQTPSAQ